MMIKHEAGRKGRGSVCPHCMGAGIGRRPQMFGLHAGSLGVCLYNAEQVFDGVLDISNT